MKVIMINHPHQLSKKDFSPMVIALGFFDGVHKGHQTVISTARKIAIDNKWKSAVMTFDPHPSVVLGKERKTVQYITPLEDKIDLISTLGIDFLFVVRFTSAFSSLEPETFINEYLINLNAKHVVAGFDYTYGRFGKGTMETMPIHGKGNFDVTTVSKLEEHNEKVSSTKIRSLLHGGDMCGAQKLLGRFYITKGTIIHGEKRGRTIGFPTANIQLESDYLIPKTGVYAVRFFVAGKWYNGVCNIGYKPTFTAPGETRLSVEVHILDFDQSIYGEKVKVEWHIHIRDEKKFNGIEELKTQISKDVQTTIAYFDNMNN
ncbi:bifunctional riboflavin kinase/FAD synthetase [Lederbergia wuyishanensis]|uniref:Riboflavin biosynthesis protein n=1 Tax=Lederbergia wuyishanensis TaxID=1347903 RepID=A0ABU0CZU8_9BACI|nr:bifunctional riboflavin kinase/FAD synthetase [Lederbergia wuyishanensis]MCJ8006310.1 bifunctional riboflavin kinase/FAD synthetase [Lederbergia wuyishanensis]MDQ0341679.1 riboflavin kinase/FMN adenylyltransferase [Lederbergia wuyishanensis]